MTSTWLRSGLLAAACFSATPALAEINPARLLLLDAERVGARLVAVGERGTVLLSDDEGQAWSARRTGTTRTLTALAFDDANTGVAVGHGGVLLRTEDGGRNWTAIDVEELAGNDSLLGVTALGSGRFVAFGAFALYLESGDAGRTWTRRQVFGEDGDAHIFQLFAADPALFLVGERGTLARSDDQGQTWTLLDSPYPGSYFGGLRTREGALLIYGMRGNVWRSGDGGRRWDAIDLGLTIGLNGGSLLDDGRIVLAGNGGLLLQSSDDGRSFTRINGASGDLAQARPSGDNTLVLVGAAGAQRVDMNPKNP